MIRISFYLIFHLFYLLIIFLFMFAFVSVLFSNTVIMLIMFMSLKAVTNNQPQVWISGHQLLVFLGIHVKIFTNVYHNAYFLYMYFVSLYLMFDYFHWLITLIVTINYLLTYSRIPALATLQSYECLQWQNIFTQDHSYFEHSMG